VVVLMALCELAGLFLNVLFDLRFEAQSYSLSIVFSEREIQRTKCAGFPRMQPHKSKFSIWSVPDSTLPPSSRLTVRLLWAPVRLLEAWRKIHFTLAQVNRQKELDRESGSRAMMRTTFVVERSNIRVECLPLVARLIACESRHYQE
jgi:hypothetical protein